MVGMIKVVKKDGTKEDFNVQKVVVAVNKSAYRALITFTQEELDFICQFVEEKVKEMQITEVPIATMHNIVEGAFGLSGIAEFFLGSVSSKVSQYATVPVLIVK